MNKLKLKAAKEHFLQLYPQGFDDIKMEEIAKKHKPQKMMEMAQDFFHSDAFKKPEQLLENWSKAVSRSSMVSLFEKPKFRDFTNYATDTEKEVIVKGLEEFLYGDQEFGFNMMVDILDQYKLAKWTLITIVPFYCKPEIEVFIKPTTTKMAINFFEMEGLEYKPKPTFDFYQKYREKFIRMRDWVGVTKDNAAFGGFIMITAQDVKKQEIKRK